MSTSVERNGFGGMRAEARTPDGPGIIIARLARWLLWSLGVGALAFGAIRLGRAMNVPLLLSSRAGISDRGTDRREIELPYAQVLPQTDLADLSRPTPTPAPLPEVAPIPAEVITPDRLAIPSIHLDAPVIPVGYRIIEQGGQNAVQWAVPDEQAAGWHALTAGLGQAGNTVLNGHNNAYGEVFKFLIDANIGDLILAYSDGREFAYRVAEKHILDERDQPLEVRQANAQWIMPTDDERLTLVTCWPYTSNTHRLILVARPTALSLDQFGEGVLP